MLDRHGELSLQHLENIARLRAKADQEIQTSIRVARRLGASWQQIADALGEPRRTLADRYRRGEFRQ
jgi:hypothetical protein